MKRTNEESYGKTRDNISMNNLKKIIDDKGYTITKVAINSGISDSTLYNYITGERIPSLPVLINLANELNCNLDYLVDRTNNPININDIDKLEEDVALSYLIHNYVSLSPQKRELLIAYVKGLLNS